MYLDKPIRCRSLQAVLHLRQQQSDSLENGAPHLDPVEPSRAAQDECSAGSVCIIRRHATRCEEVGWGECAAPGRPALSSAVDEARLEHGQQGGTAVRKPQKAIYIKVSCFSSVLLIHSLALGL